MILAKEWERLNHFLFEHELKRSNVPTRFLLQAFRITYAVFRDLADGQLSLRAMSLVYTTVIAIVPLLAICFSVLKGFGVHNQIEPFSIRFIFSAW